MTKSALRRLRSVTFATAAAATIAALTVLVATAPAAEPLSALAPNAVVLFQGDSITDGGRQRSGNDYNHIMGQDYAYLIAAQLGARYPERNITFVNRGISANRVTDLARRWQSDTLDVKPTFLSLLIGVNDLLVPKQGETVEQYESVYDQLIADTRKALPDTKIVLGEPFLLPVGNQKAAFSTNQVALKRYQEAVHRLGQKYRLPVIPYQNYFDDACRKAPADHWSWDGIHPTYAGHGLMAEAWIKTVDDAKWKGAVLR